MSPKKAEEKRGSNGSEPDISKMGADELMGYIRDKIQQTLKHQAQQTNTTKRGPHG